MQRNLALRTIRWSIALVALALLVLGARFVLTAVPGSAGSAAKQLCSLAYVLRSYRTLLARTASAAGRPNCSRSSAVSWRKTQQS